MTAERQQVLKLQHVIKGKPNSDGDIIKDDVFSIRCHLAQVQSEECCGVEQKYQIHTYSLRDSIFI